MESIKNKAAGEANEKQSLNREDKKRLCEQWKTSGKPVEKFCREHGLAISSFYTWRKRLWGKLKGSSCSDFVPVKNNASESTPPKSEKALVEVALPNQAVIRVTLPMAGVVSFIQELCDAVTIIR